MKRLFPSPRPLLLAAILTMTALAAVAITLLPGSARAQNSSSGFTTLILNDQTARADLSEKFYAINDPEHSLSVRALTTRVVTGQFANNIAKSPVVNLGLAGTTTWLLFPVTNVSSSDVWELDFGDSTNGRQTLMDQISIYSSFNGKLIYESDPQNQPSYSIASQVRLNIPVGQSGFIIVEMSNPSGTLSTISLSLKRAYAADTSRSFGTVFSARLPLICGIILLTAFIMRRSFSFAAFGGAWLLAYTQHYIVDHYIFISGISAGLLPQMIWLGVALLLLVGFWLSDEEDNQFPPALFMGIGFLCLVCGLIGLLTADFMPTVSIALSYGPLALVCLLIVFMSWLMSIQIRDHTYALLLLMGLSVILAMVSTYLAAYAPSLAAQPFIKGGANLGLSIAPVFTACFALIRSYGSASLLPARAMPAAAAPAAQNRDLAEAKENSEHKRLLQVLEQERATMGEMQVQEARRTEEMRKAKEAADEANTAKSAFLAVVSHEIRTPMTGIMGMVRLLFDTSLSREQKEYASTIQDSGEALMALLNDILDFEKIESGKLELEHADFDMHRLLRGVQTLMNGHAASKDVELRLEIDPKLPQFIVGDPTRLRQVLLNLVNNAIKFTSKGAVYIRVNDMTPEDRLGESIHQLYFGIQDSGIGIAPEAQKKLFLPFAQADSSTSRKYGGTGLGLAICKRLIEVMGGMINISSKPGEGSTFFFTLSMPVGHEDMVSSFSSAASSAMAPSHQPHSATSQPPSSPFAGPSMVSLGERPAMVNLNAGKSLYILVVDDNGINQKVLTGLIEKQGHRVVTASTGTEALGKYLAATYDLVLMDLELPDRSGIDVTHDIRQLQEADKASVPIVAMTGNTAQEDIRACYDAGMNDFLAKPISPERLKQILDTAGGTGVFERPPQPRAVEEPAAKPPTQIRILPVSKPPETLLETADEITYVPMPPQPLSVPPSTYIPVPPPAPATADLAKNPALQFALDDLDDGEEEDTFASAIQSFEDIETQKKSGTGAIADTIDEKMLGTLKDTLSPEQMTELLEGFYEKAEELVTAIGQSYLAHDLRSLGARAHELKGMAGNFGFSGVSTLAAQIEKAAKDNTPDDLKYPVDHLGETYALSKARLASWFGA